MQCAMITSMCKCSQSEEISFLMKNVSLSFPIEAWAYILKLCNEKNVTVNGQFLVNRKHLQMCSNLDLTAVRITGETFTVRLNHKAI